jgi:DNA topoisomerase IA
MKVSTLASSAISLITYMRTDSTNVAEMAKKERANSSSSAMSGFLHTSPVIRQIRGAQKPEAIANRHPAA